MRYTEILAGYEFDERVMGCRHAIEDIEGDDISDLKANIVANGYDQRRPVIVLVDNPNMLDINPRRWDNSAAAVVQGRHRIRAMRELSGGGDAWIYGVLITCDEYDRLRDQIGDANDIEAWLMERIDVLMDAEDEDVEIDDLA